MPRTSMNEVVNTPTGRVTIWKDRDTGQLLYGTPWVESVSSYQRVKIRSTWNTPGFRLSRPEGLPMNPFTYLETQRVWAHGVMQSWGDITREELYSYGGLAVGSFNTSSDGLSTSMENSINSQALNKSLSDLKGMKANLGVAFAERKRTSSLILGTAGRIGNSLRALRKGNFAGAAKALGIDAPKGRRTVGSSKALANEWLALQYGWKPLLSDVYNAADDLARISQEPRRFKVSSSRTFVWNNTSVPSEWNNVPYTRREWGSYTRKYVYIFSYSNEVLTDLSRFGVTNPASVAWELLPWSFVIDWFIPVGNFIDTWDATLGFTFEKGSRTTFKKYFVEAVANGSKYRNDVKTFYRTKARGDYMYVRCDREALGAFPFPALPSFDPRITFNRGASTLALLRQRLRL